MDRGANSVRLMVSKRLKEKERKREKQKTKKKKKERDIKIYKEISRGQRE